jgi:hypothetical protein
MPESMKHEEFLRLIETLDEQQKKHYREVIEILIQCYGDKPTMQAVVVYKNLKFKTASIISANCNDMDATGLLLPAASYFESITTRGAPPKEQFN